VTAARTLDGAGQFGKMNIGCRLWAIAMARIVQRWR